MTFEEYQNWTEECPLFDDPALGLPGEVGEVLELIKKDRRTGDRHKPMNLEDLEKELGDVLWYLNKVATSYGLKLNGIALANQKKLTKRHNLA
jgi:NTP pyrophosphatase (non-canonical NTP hydrolase)